jgi:hypothetical protein
VRKQRVILEYVAAAASLRWPADAAGAVEPHLIAIRDAATIGSHSPGQSPEHGRLAGARSAGKGEASPCGDFELNVEIDPADGVSDLSA